MSVLAQYHGTCTSCDDLIVPGERIEPDGQDGTWRHVDCGAIPEQAPCACAKCFLVHAGSCY